MARQTAQFAPAGSTSECPSDSAMERRRWLWFAAGLTVAVLLAYQPAWHGGFVWDDNDHVTRPDLRSWQGLYRIWFDFGATP
jgi:protein O-mannosyl-transferase